MLLTVFDYTNAVDTPWGRFYLKLRTGETIEQAFYREQIRLMTPVIPKSKVKNKETNKEKID